MSHPRPGSRFPLRPGEDDRGVGFVRRVDSGRTPDRHPAAVRWLDDRRPRPKRVEGTADPRADALRERLDGAQGRVPVSAVPLGRRDIEKFPRGGAPWAGDQGDDGAPARGGLGTPTARVGGYGRRTRRRRDGVEANARLTGMTAVVLLVLFAVEGFTILRIFPLLSIHVFVGMLLIPIVLVKLGSVTWRFAKYYQGDPEYRRRGPPAPLLRLIGPIVIVLTLVLLFGGVALLLVPHDGGAREALLRVHQVSFVLWFIVMVVHVLGHILDTAKLAPRDWYWRTRRQVRGASTRQWVLASSVVVGLVAGAVTLPDVGVWLAGVQASAHPAVHAVHPAAHSVTTASR